MLLNFPDYTISIRKKLRTRSRYNYLLIHGFVADSRESFRLAHKLVDGNVYAIDLLCHGNSVLKNQSLKLTHNVIAKSIAAVIDRLALTNVIIIGHSIGASMAAIVGSSHPQVKKIVLLSPPPISVAKNQPLIDRLMATDSQVIKKLIHEDLLYHPNFITAMIMKRIIIRKNYRLKESHQKFLNDMSSSITVFKFNHFLKKIKKPTLIISGLEDPISPPKSIKDTSQHIAFPHDLVFLPKTRHSLCLQHTNKVLEIINKWNKNEMVTK